MIAVKFKLWRTVGAATALTLAAACGGEGGAASGEGGEGGEGGEAGASTPAATATRAPAAGAGEAGEAGAASAYAGLSGDQLTALRIQHLRGFVMAAARMVQDGVDKPVEAGVLVAQGVLEVYDPAPEEFGTLNIEIIRAAASGDGLTRAQMMQRIRAAEDEIDRAMGGLDVDYPALIARLVDIATGLYQQVNQGDYVDAIEYQHSMGAAYSAAAALTLGQDAMRRENFRAFSRVQGELNRFTALWRTPEAPERPPTYAEVLAQGSRVRLALSPYL